METDCDANYSLLAPTDWENQTQQTPIDYDINNGSSYYDTDEEEQEQEEDKKWLMWLNSDAFWKVPEKHEIMLEIFSRVPPKSILRFRCLSKKFLDFTKQHGFLSKQMDSTKDDVTGFFGQRTLRQDNVVNPHNLEGIGYINLKSNLYSMPDPMLKFVIGKNSGDMVRLIDSCNGLLLCINSNSVKTCFVCNPFTKEKVALPNSHRQSTQVNCALIADLDGKGYLKYMVVCLVRKKGRVAGTDLLIFSSEKGEWEEIKADLPPMNHPTMMGSKVFFKGSLFWDCFETHILVCHLEKKILGRCYELVEAPRAYLGRCLWKFNEKLICYCHGYEGDIPSWSLSANEFGDLEWKSEGCEMFETMSEVISKESLENLLSKSNLKNPPQVIFKIIAHDPVLNKVYFLVKDSIFSYRLWGKEVDMVGRFYYTRQWDGRIFDGRWEILLKPCVVVAYRHSLAQIQKANTKKAKEEERGREGDLKEKDKLLESVVKKDNEVASMYDNCSNKVKPRGRKGKKVKHKGKDGENDEEENVDFLESNKTDDDEFASSLCEDGANKVGPRHGKEKRINFSLLQLDDQ